jgi:hypothetical protein
VTEEQAIIEAQKMQIEACRAAFFRLAAIRAAELVIHQDKSLEQALEYRNAELNALDQQLAGLVPELPETPDPDFLEVDEEACLEPRECAETDGDCA